MKDADFLGISYAPDQPYKVGAEIFTVHWKIIGPHPEVEMDSILHPLISLAETNTQIIETLGNLIEWVDYFLRRATILEGEH